MIRLRSFAQLKVDVQVVPILRALVGDGVECLGSSGTQKSRDFDEATNEDLLGGGITMTQLNKILEGKRRGFFRIDEQGRFTGLGIGPTGEEADITQCNMQFQVKGPSRSLSSPSPSGIKQGVDRRLARHC